MQEMLEQAQKLQQDFAVMQQEAVKRTCEASAGGGMVTVCVNGKPELISLKIDPAVVNSGDVEMLQDLIAAAINEALRKSKASTKEEMSKLTGGLNIPLPGFGS